MTVDVKAVRFHVMPGHSRSKNGVLSHAYDPGIHDDPQHGNFSDSAF
jgi:hypothetical protein